ncbi:hypothetical protein D3C81_1535350 [compost metagenome]
MDHERPLHFLHQPLGDGLGLPELFDLGDDRKLIAGQTYDQVAHADARADTYRDGFQQFVAKAMPVKLIDSTEAIHANHQHRLALAWPAAGLS